MPDQTPAEYAKQNSYTPDKYQYTDKMASSDKTWGLFTKGRVQPNKNILNMRMDIDEYNQKMMKEQREMETVRQGKAFKEANRTLAPWMAVITDKHNGSFQKATELNKVSDHPAIQEFLGGKLNVAESNQQDAEGNPQFQFQILDKEGNPVHEFTDTTRGMVMRLDSQMNPEAKRKVREAIREARSKLDATRKMIAEDPGVLAKARTKQLMNKNLTDTEKAVLNYATVYPGKDDDETVANFRADFDKKRKATEAEVQAEGTRKQQKHGKEMKKLDAEIGNLKGKKEIQALIKSGKYTPESVKEYGQTGDPADLVLTKGKAADATKALDEALKGFDPQDGGASITRLNIANQRAHKAGIPGVIIEEVEGEQMVREETAVEFYTGTMEEGETKEFDGPNGKGNYIKKDGQLFFLKKKAEKKDGAATPKPKPKPTPKPKKEPPKGKPPVPEADKDKFNSIMKRIMRKHPKTPLEEAEKQALKEYRAYAAARDKRKREQGKRAGQLGSSLPVGSRYDDTNYYDNLINKSAGGS